MLLNVGGASTEINVRLVSDDLIKAAVKRLCLPVFAVQMARCNM
jgi:hypothetical protein